MTVYVVLIGGNVSKVFTDEREAQRCLNSFRSTHIAKQRKWRKAHPAAEGWHVSGYWRSTYDMETEYTPAGYLLPTLAIYKVPVDGTVETDFDPSVRIVSGWAH